MTKLHPIAMLIACIFIIEILSAQDSVNRPGTFLLFPTRFLERVDKKSSLIEEKILAKSERVLHQLAKEEKRLRRKVMRKNSVLARQLKDAEGQYKSLQSKLTGKANTIGVDKEYIPWMDTLTTSLRFLQKSTSFNDSKLLQQSMTHIKDMENRFQQAREIQQHLRTRRQYLKEQLSKLNMVKVLQRYNKKVYYYHAQMQEYKQILKQPEKLERKAIDLLSKTKPFQDFMSKYSILGSLFPGPLPISSANWRRGVTIPGLQTTTQVNALIQQTAGGGSNLQALQSNILQAQFELQKIKDGLSSSPFTGGGQGEAELPDFRPNNQRVKSFWNRWELGTNLQSTRSNNWMPTATQIGLSAGYKLNDRSVVGLGMAGSIGWGRDIKNITVSYEGIGARSFLDWKLKGSFWLSAGYEMNYQTRFTRIEQLSSLSAWQQSGLIGISKKYKVSKKIKGSMNLLWDYLSYSQIPRTQAVVFRFGYNIK